MVRKYYHKCTECNALTYYQPGSDNNKKKVTSSEMSRDEKQKIYYARYKAKKNEEKSL